MGINSLQELYHEELRDLLSVEQQILKALPKIVKAASCPDLKKALANHLKETQVHVQRLNRIFEGLGEKPRARKCKGMEGILEESKKFMGEAENSEVMDAGLIGVVQRVEHYEMAAYGTVRTYANQLGDVASELVLQKTLDEEGRADKKLTELAKAGINVEAVSK